MELKKMMMILVVMKILTAITRGRDDSDKGKAMMIKNDSAPLMRIWRNVLMIIFMLISTMSIKTSLQNIWWTMALFFTIFIFFLNSYIGTVLRWMRNRFPSNISLGVCLLFCRLDVGLLGFFLHCKCWFSKDRIYGTG